MGGRGWARQCPWQHQQQQQCTLHHRTSEGGEERPVQRRWSAHACPDGRGGARGWCDPAERTLGIRECIGWMAGGASPGRAGGALAMHAHCCRPVAVVLDQRLSSAALHRVFRAPGSFFDTIPLGRITNRSSPPPPPPPPCTGSVLRCLAA
jgi:hypothetical protein